MAGRYLDCFQCAELQKALDKLEALLSSDPGQEQPNNGNSSDNNSKTSFAEETSSLSAPTAGKHDDPLAKALAAQTAPGFVGSFELEFSHGLPKFLGALNDSYFEWDIDEEPPAKRAKTAHEREVSSGESKGAVASEEPKI